MKRSYLMMWMALVGCGLAVLSPAAAAAESPTELMFTRTDSNHDGKVSADEHAASARGMFAAMDSNRDGKVTADEMRAAQPRVTGGAPSPSTMSAEDKIKAIDTNADGIVSDSEHAAGSREMFDRMDTNHDHFLTRDEYVAGHARLMK
jgi:Ca2+-binding EF-hand superfamily protein